MEVVRGYIIPIRRNDGFLYSEVISEAEAIRTFNEFKKVVGLVVKDFLNNEKISSADDFNKVLNSLVLYLRSMFYLDPVPEVIGSATSGMYVYYKVANFDKKSKPYLLNNIREIYDKINANRNLFVNTQLYDDQVRESILRLLRFPADTRPACNTSSLLIHSLVTSAFATSLYLENKSNNATLKELVILRLASLFHDIGKVSNWAKHEEISAEFVQEIFGCYVEGEEAKEILESAKKLIRESEASTSFLYGIFKRADIIASNVDRVKGLLLKVIAQRSDLMSDLESKMREYSNNYEKNFNDLFEELFDDWEFWNNRLGVNYIKDLTEEFCKVVSKISSENPTFLESKEELPQKKLDDGVLIARLDIRQIQSYIKNNDLRAMIGGSRIIDIATYLSSTFILTEELKLPPELILYSGGGNITLLVPKSKSNEIEEVQKFFKEEKIKISVGFSPLFNEFSIINRNIDVELSKIKMAETHFGTISPNIFQVCRYCGKEYACCEAMGDFVCETCKIKIGIGNTLHFKEKWERLEEHKQEKTDFEKVSKRVIEYISGHTLEEIEKEEIEKYYNVALIRFDANLASQIMASCISITDAVERSIRIDYSVKKAFSDFLKLIKSVDKELGTEHYNRLVLGTIYIGGDDGCLLVPSAIVVPLTLFLLNEYYLNMGGKSTLSIGIAVGKPKHPISLLYSSAGWLLDRAKKNTRKLAFDYSHGAIVSSPSSKFRGSLMFFVADGSNMSPEALSSALREVHHDGLSLQYCHSFTLSDQNEYNSIFRLLGNLSLYSDLNLSNLNDDNIKKIISSSVSKGSLISKTLEEELREIRKELLKCMEATILGKSELEIKIMFSMKEKEEEKGKKIVSEIIGNLLSFSGSKAAFALYDLYQMIKLLGGGII
jgi:hypothetical protein